MSVAAWLLAFLTSGSSVPSEAHEEPNRVLSHGYAQLYDAAKGLRDRHYVEVVELLDREFFRAPASTPLGAAGAAR